MEMTVGGITDYLEAALASNPENNCL